MLTPANNAPWEPKRPNDTINPSEYIQIVTKNGLQTTLGGFKKIRPSEAANQNELSLENKIKAQEEYISQLIADSQNTDIPLGMRWIWGLIMEIRKYVWFHINPEENIKQNISLRDILQISQEIHNYTSQHWEWDSLKAWKDELIEGLGIPSNIKNPWLEIWKKTINKIGIKKKLKRAT